MSTPAANQPALAGGISPRRLHLVLLAAICLLVTVASWRTLSLDFAAFDDEIQLIDNDKIRTITPETLRWMFTDTELTQRYTPLSWVSWALLVQVAGRSSMAFHAFNLVMHLVNVCLVYFLILAILRRLEKLKAMEHLFPLAAALATALWAVHPMRVEVIGWATQVRYSEAQACAIGALLLYFRATRCQPDKPWTTGAYWGSAACYAASVLFYPSAIALVALIPLLDLYLLRRDRAEPFMMRLRRLSLQVMPYLLGTFVAGLMTLYARVTSKGFWGTPVTLQEFGIFDRIMQAAYVFTFYLWKPFNPTKISPMYTDVTEFNPYGPAFLLSLAVVIGVTVAAFAWRRRFPGLFLLWMAHLLILAPVGGYFEHPYLLNDRYSYLHGVLFAIALANGLVWLLGHPGLPDYLRRVIPISTIAAILVFAFLSSAQLLTWQTPETTLVHALEEMKPNDPFRKGVYWQLGKVYRDQGRFAEGIEQCDLTLHEDPRHYVALNLRMDCLLGLIGQLQTTKPAALPGAYMELASTADRIVALGQDDPRTYLAASIAYQRAGRGDLAEQRMVEAVSKFPEDASLRMSLAELLVRGGRREEGMKQLDAAIRLQPALAADRDRLLAAWSAGAASAPASQPTH